MRFLLAFLILNIIMSFVFANPMFMLILLIVGVVYYAYKSYQRSKIYDDFKNQYYQQDNTYTNNQQRTNNDDIIDVEYTEKDITDKQ